jgi:putative transposase
MMAFRYRCRPDVSQRARTKHAIAVLHARAADRRRDWAEKTSTRLVAGHDLIVFEDLRVKDMLRSARGTVELPGRNVAAKAALNRRIAASAWSRLIRRITEKAAASQGCEVKGSLTSGRPAKREPTSRRRHE